MRTTKHRVKEWTKLAFSHQLVPGVSPPVLDNMPYLNLDWFLTFFIRSKAYQINILQIFWTDIQFHEKVLNCAWFSIVLSSNRYIQIGDETRFRGLKLNGISQGGIFFFPLPGQQSIQNTCREPHHNSPPPPLSTGNPGRIGGGISQSNWNLSKGGALSQYQVNNYPKCMLSMTIHLP